MTAYAIQVDQLTKVYGNGRGIHAVSMDVRAGEIFGFLGPNGAGKSTTIRTLMGFLTPSGGRAAVLGFDVATQGLEVRERVGYLPSDITLYEGLTGEENIRFALSVRGRASNLSRAESMAKRLEIDLKRRVKTLSRGQRQKTAIIAAMAHDPEVLIFDEPTTGLDPLAQEVFHAIVREEVKRGKTLLVSSHVLSEVEELCDRVAIIRDGRIVTTDTVTGLKRQRVKRVAVEFRGAAPNLAAVPGVTDLTSEGPRVRFTLVGSVDPVLTALAAHPVVDLTVQDPTLEEIFMKFYTGQEAAAR